MEAVVGLIALFLLGKVAWWGFKNLVKGTFFIMLGLIFATIIMGAFVFFTQH